MPTKKELEARLAKYEPPKRNTLMDKINEIEAGTKEKITALIEKCEDGTGRRLKYGFNIDPITVRPEADLMQVLKYIGKKAARSGDFRDSLHFSRWARDHLLHGYKDHS